MSTIQLVIICVTVLAALIIVARLLRERDQRRAQLQREVAMHERATARPAADLAAAVEALTRTAHGLEAAAPRRGPGRVGQRVTVHTKQPDDQTLYGVVVGDYTDRLCLDDANYVTSDGTNPPLPGRQEIATRDIAWIDVHGQVAVPSHVEA